MADLGRAAAMLGKISLARREMALISWVGIDRGGEAMHTALFNGKESDKDKRLSEEGGVSKDSREISRP